MFTLMFHKKIFRGLTAVMLLITLSTGATSVMAQTSLAEVAGLKVDTVGNKTVTLKWNAVANANNYKVLYGTSTVESNAEYNRPPIDTGNVTSFTVNNLTNGTKYYFSVIATNGATTSLYYGEEVSATPTAEGANAAPTIVSTTSDAADSFVISFSKDMALDANLAAQIKVVKSNDESSLVVKDTTKVSATKLKVTTDPQDAGSEYRVTLTDQFKDSAGTPIENVERSSILIGFSGELASNLFGAAEDAGDLKVTEITVLPDKKGVELSFNKEVIIGENPVAQIVILETNNLTAPLGVLDVKANKEDNTKILIVTEEQKEVSYTILVTGFKDAAGKLIAEANSTVEFNGGSTQAGTPQDVVDLAGDFIDLAKIIVNLTWGSSPDVEAADFKGYAIYLSTDGGENFDLLDDSLTGDLTEFTTDSLSPAEKYLFKVTAKNEKGESEGAVVELELPGTGPVGLALIAFGSLGLGRIVTKRKN